MALTNLLTNLLSKSKPTHTKPTHTLTLTNLFYTHTNVFHTHTCTNPIHTTTSKFTRKFTLKLPTTTTASKFILILRLPTEYIPKEASRASG